MADEPETFEEFTQKLNGYIKRIIEAHMALGETVGEAEVLAVHDYKDIMNRTPVSESVKLIQESGNAREIILSAFDRHITELENKSSN